MLNKIKNEIAKSIVAITIFTTTYATKVFAGRVKDLKYSLGHLLDSL